MAFNPLQAEDLGDPDDQQVASGDDDELSVKFTDRNQGVSRGITNGRGASSCRRSGIQRGRLPACSPAGPATSSLPQPLPRLTDPQDPFPSPSTRSSAR